MIISIFKQTKMIYNKH